MNWYLTSMMQTGFSIVSVEMNTERKFPKIWQRKLSIHIWLAKEYYSIPLQP